MEVLGSGLGWHGALSADVIVTATGVLFIDVNPRLVEPTNAWFAGVDLVGALLDVATGRPPVPEGPDRPGVATHQLLLAVLGAAQHGRGAGGCDGADGGVAPSRPLFREPRGAHSRPAGSSCRHSHCPGRGGHAGPPGQLEWFVSGSVQSYSLTASAWDEVRAVAARS